MTQISVHYDHANVSDADIKKLGEQLKPEIKRIADAWGVGYDSEYASLSLLNDKGLHQTIHAVVSEKQKLKPKILIVIGIGGSNLGSIAVHEALQGILYNQFNPFKVYFADTVDSSYIGKLLALTEDELKKDHNVLLAIISKSGTTTETIANAEVFINLMQKYKNQNYHQNIVTITDEDSPLWQRAKEHNWTTLLIPKMVGGRYSVFSAVGLFPLAMLGINIEEFVRGAQSVKEACINEDITKNPAALSATTLYYNHRQGMMIHDTFVFAKRLKSIGAWYRQLMGESIGKAESKTGEVINEGITPTVSIGSIDLHSVAQLYLAGPYDKFTTFLSINKMPSDIRLPKESPLSGVVKNIQDKSFNEIMSAMLHGTQIAYTKNKRPFISVELPEISAYYIGQLMQAKMVKMMYLGFLLDVNPFDQPQVELYKKETRKILANE